MHDIVVILGSQSDRDRIEPPDKKPSMLKALSAIGAEYEVSFVSAHRNPEELSEYVKRKVQEGTRVFVGIAGMAAALPGAISAILGGRKPVLGVALSSSPMDGLDALLSQVRMPPGRPVMVCGLDEEGAYNAALAACAIVALGNEGVCRRLTNFLTANNKPPQIGVISTTTSEGA